MVLRYRDGVVPAVPTDPSLDAELEGLPQEVAALMDRAEPTVALDLIWQRVRRLNRYVEERAPWQLARDESRAAELDRTLTTLYEGVRALTVLLHPFMPDSTDTLLAALGAPGTVYAAADFLRIPLGTVVEPLDPLFPKRD